MNRRLAGLAAVSLSIAAACGIITVLTSATDWINDDYRSWAGPLRTCAAMPWAKKTGSGERRTVELEWPGSDAVKIKIPAQVHYQPGPKPQASVSGDADLVSHVRLRDGTLEWDTVEWDSLVDCFPAGDLVVHLAGPAVTAWTLNGSGELDLSDISQEALRITMHGSGAVTASGEAHEATLDATGSGRADLGRLVAQKTSANIHGSVDLKLADIKQDVLRITMRGSGVVTASGAAHEVSLEAAGSGRADLGRLIAERANAQIHGSANVDLAPRQDADISISGSAVVKLHGAVARINSHVSGSGEIKQVP
jgi:Putative auto-transporter adhesin, head GIN domain